MSQRLANGVNGSGLLAFVPRPPIALATIYLNKRWGS